MHCHARLGLQNKVFTVSCISALSPSSPHREVDNGYTYQAANAIMEVAIRLAAMLTLELVMVTMA